MATVLIMSDGTVNVQGYNLKTKKKSNISRSELFNKIDAKTKKNFQDQKKIIFKNVADIDHGTCALFKNLEEVELDCLNIGRQAFRGCEKLKTVTFTKTIETIDMLAFAHCPNLETIEINAKNVELGAFKGCTKLKHVTIIDTERHDKSLGPKLATYGKTPRYSQGSSAGVKNSEGVMGTLPVAYGIFEDCTDLQSVSLSENNFKKFIQQTADTKDDSFHTSKFNALTKLPASKVEDNEYLYEKYNFFSNNIQKTKNNDFKDYNVLLFINNDTNNEDDKQYTLNTANDNVVDDSSGKFKLNAYLDYDSDVYNEKINEIIKSNNKVKSKYIGAIFNKTHPKISYEVTTLYYKYIKDGEKDPTELKYRIANVNKTWYDIYQNMGGNPEGDSAADWLFATKLDLEEAQYFANLNIDKIVLVDEQLRAFNRSKITDDGIKNNNGKTKSIGLMKIYDEHLADIPKNIISLGFRAAKRERRDGELLQPIPQEKEVGIISNSIFSMFNNLEVFGVHNHNFMYIIRYGILYSQRAIDDENDENIKNYHELIYYPPKKTHFFHAVPMITKSIHENAFDSLINNNDDINNIHLLINHIDDNIPDKIKNIAYKIKLTTENYSDLITKMNDDNDKTMLHYFIKDIITIEKINDPKMSVNDRTNNILNEIKIAVDHYFKYTNRSDLNLKLFLDNNEQNNTKVKFNNNKSVTIYSHQLIADHVLIIKAKEDITNITRIDIPSRITSIDTGLLNDENLQNIHVNESNGTYSSIYGVLYNKNKIKLIRYPRNKNITTLIIHANTSTLDDNAFNDVKNKPTNIFIGKDKKITISDVTNTYKYGGNNKFTLNDNTEATSLIDIYTNTEVSFNSLKSNYGYSDIDTSGSFAIDYTTIDGESKAITIFDKNNNKLKSSYFTNIKTNVKTINIPEEIKSIEDNIFDELENLESINVDDKNSNYSSINGVLYNKNKTELIRYPINKDSAVLVIYANANINQNAFNDVNKYPTNIIISNEEDQEIEENQEADEDQEVSDEEISKLFEKIKDVQLYLYNGDNKFTLNDNNISIDSVLSTLGLNIKDFTNNNYDISTNQYTIKYTTTIDEEKEIKVYSAYLLNDHFDTIENIKTITIPKEITSIEDNTFDELENLETIIVHKDNEIYASHDGVLYADDYELLFRYPRNKQTTTPFIFHVDTKNINILDNNNLAFKGVKNLPKNIFVSNNFTFENGTFKDTNIYRQTPENKNEFALNGSITSAAVELINDKIVSYNELKSYLDLTKLSILILLDDNNKKHEYFIEGTEINETIETKENIISITIPENITNIVSNADVEGGEEEGGEKRGVFDKLLMLENIIVDDKNSNYSSIDGVLYNKDKTELIRYPINKKGNFFIVHHKTNKINSEHTFSELTLTHLKNIVMKNLVISNDITDKDNNKFSKDNLYQLASKINVFVQSLNINNSDYSSDVSLKQKNDHIFKIINDKEFKQHSIINLLNNFQIKIENDNDKYLLKNSIFSNYYIDQKDELYDQLYKIDTDNSELTYYTTLKLKKDHFDIDNVKNITSITIPKDVVLIEDEAFNDFENLKEILVEDDHKHFSSKDGILYSKDAEYDRTHYVKITPSSVSNQKWKYTMTKTKYFDDFVFPGAYIKVVDDEDFNSFVFNFVNGRSGYILEDPNEWTIHNPPMPRYKIIVNHYSNYTKYFDEYFQNIRIKSEKKLIRFPRNKELDSSTYIIDYQIVEDKINSINNYAFSNIKKLKNLFIPGTNFKFKDDDTDNKLTYYFYDKNKKYFYKKKESTTNEVEYDRSNASYLRYLINDGTIVSNDFKNANYDEKFIGYITTPIHVKYHRVEKLEDFNKEDFNEEDLIENTVTTYGNFIDEKLLNDDIEKHEEIYSLTIHDSFEYHTMIAFDKLTNLVKFRLDDDKDRNDTYFIIEDCLFSISDSTFDTVYTGSGTVDGLQLIRFPPNKKNVSYFELMPNQNKKGGGYTPWGSESDDLKDIDGNPLRIYKGANERMYGFGFITKIGPKAFAYNKHVKHLIIPGSIRMIGHYCFEGSNIESIGISATSIYRLEEYTFYNCKNLKYIRSDILSNLRLYSTDGTLRPVREYLSDVIIPRNIKIIDESAFEGCESIERVSFYELLKTVGDNVFKNCTNLLSVGFASYDNNALTLNASMFKNCNKLEYISISESTAEKSDLTIGSQQQLFNKNFIVDIKKDKFKFQMEYLAKNGPIEYWNTRLIKDMSNLFQNGREDTREGHEGEKIDTTNFDRNISNWDVISVTNVDNMFEGATAMNEKYPVTKIDRDGDDWDNTYDEYERFIETKIFDFFNFRLTNEFLKIIVDDWEEYREYSKFIEVIENLNTKYLTDMSNLFKSTRKHYVDKNNNKIVFIYDETMGGFNANDYEIIYEDKEKTKAKTNNDGQVLAHKKSRDTFKNIDIDIRKWDVSRVTNFGDTDPDTGASTGMFHGATFTKNMFEKYTKNLPSLVKEELNKELVKPNTKIENIVLSDYFKLKVKKEEQKDNRYHIFKYKFKSYRINSYAQGQDPLGNQIESPGTYRDNINDMVNLYFKGKNRYGYPVTPQYLKEIKDLYGPISNWNVEAVKDMQDVFAYIDYEMIYTDEKHEVEKRIEYVYDDAAKKDGNTYEIIYDKIDGIDVKRTNDDGEILAYKIIELGDLSEWDVSNVTDMQSMFRQSKNANNIGISNWDVSNVTNMSRMFENCFNFDENISNWKVDNVRNMYAMFFNCNDFNQNLSNWDVSKVTDMSLIFSECDKFNNGNELSDNGDKSSDKDKPLVWTLSSVTNLSNMFRDSSFNSEIEFIGLDKERSIQNDEGEKVIKYINMERMFSRNKSFNSTLTMDVSQVNNMNSMFEECTEFNQDISAWDVSNVTTMQSMFYKCSNFNQNIGSWKVDNVINMKSMFSYCNKFNQDLTKWNVDNLKEYNDMFSNCKDMNLYQSNSRPSIMNKDEEGNHNKNKYFTGKGAEFSDIYKLLNTTLNIQKYTDAIKLEENKTLDINRYGETINFADEFPNRPSIFEKPAVSLNNKSYFLYKDTIESIVIQSIYIGQNKNYTITIKPSMKYINTLKYISRFLDIDYNKFNENGEDGENLRKLVYSEFVDNWILKINIPKNPYVLDNGEKKEFVYDDVENPNDYEIIFEIKEGKRIQKVNNNGKVLAYKYNKEGESEDFLFIITNADGKQEINEVGSAPKTNTEGKILAYKYDSNNADNKYILDDNNNKKEFVYDENNRDDYEIIFVASDYSMTFYFLKIDEDPNGKFIKSIPNDEFIKSITNVDAASQSTIIDSRKINYISWMTKSEFFKLTYQNSITIPNINTSFMLNKSNENDDTVINNITNEGKNFIQYLYSATYNIPYNDITLTNTTSDSANVFSIETELLNLYEINENDITRSNELEKYINDAHNEFISSITTWKENFIKIHGFLISSLPDNIDTTIANLENIENQYNNIRNNYILNVIEYWYINTVNTKERYDIEIKNYEDDSGNVSDEFINNKIKIINENNKNLTEYGNFDKYYLLLRKFMYILDDISKYKVTKYNGLTEQIVNYFKNRFEKFQTYLNSNEIRIIIHFLNSSTIQLTETLLNIDNYALNSSNISFDSFFENLNVLNSGNITEKQNIEAVIEDNNIYFKQTIKENEIPDIFDLHIVSIFHHTTRHVKNIVNIIKKRIVYSDDLSFVLDDTNRPKEFVYEKQDGNKYEIVYEEKDGKIVEKKNKDGKILAVKFTYLSALLIGFTGQEVNDRINNRIYTGRKFNFDDKQLAKNIYNDNKKTLVKNIFDYLNYNTEGRSLKDENFDNLITLVKNMIVELSFLFLITDKYNNSFNNFEYNFEETKRTNGKFYLNKVSNNNNSTYIRELKQIFNLDKLTLDSDGYLDLNNLKDKYKYPNFKKNDSDGQETDELIEINKLNINDYTIAELVQYVKLLIANHKKYRGPINLSEKDIIVKNRNAQASTTQDFIYNIEFSIKGGKKYIADTKTQYGTINNNIINDGIALFYDEYKGLPYPDLTDFTIFYDKNNVSAKEETISTYKLDNNGDPIPKTDEAGNIVYVLNENGEKIPTGELDENQDPIYYISYEMENKDIFPGQISYSVDIENDNGVTETKTVTFNDSQRLGTYELLETNVKLLKMKLDDDGDILAYKFNPNYDYIKNPDGSYQEIVYNDAVKEDGNKYDIIYVKNDREENVEKTNDSGDILAYKYKEQNKYILDGDNKKEFKYKADEPNSYEIIYEEEEKSTKQPYFYNKKPVYIQTEDIDGNALNHKPFYFYYDTSGGWIWANNSIDDKYPWDRIELRLPNGKGEKTDELIDVIETLFEYSTKELPTFDYKEFIVYYKINLTEGENEDNTLGKYTILHKNNDTNSSLELSNERPIYSNGHKRIINKLDSDSKSTWYLLGTNDNEGSDVASIKETTSSNTEITNEEFNIGKLFEKTDYSLISKSTSDKNKKDDEGLEKFNVVYKIDDLTDHILYQKSINELTDKIKSEEDDTKKQELITEYRRYIDYRLGTYELSEYELSGDEKDKFESTYSKSDYIVYKQTLNNDAYYNDDTFGIDNKVTYYVHVNFKDNIWQWTSNTIFAGRDDKIKFNQTAHQNYMPNILKQFGYSTNNIPFSEEFIIYYNTSNPFDKDDIIGNFILQSIDTNNNPVYFNGRVKFEFIDGFWSLGDKKASETGKFDTMTIENIINTYFNYSTTKLGATITSKQIKQAKLKLTLPKSSALSLGYKMLTFDKLTLSQYYSYLTSSKEEGENVNDLLRSTWFIKLKNTTDDTSSNPILFKLIFDDQNKEDQNKEDQNKEDQNKEDQNKESNFVYFQIDDIYIKNASEEYEKQNDETKLAELNDNTKNPYTHIEFYTHIDIKNYITYNKNILATFKYSTFTKDINLFISGNTLTENGEKKIIPRVITFDPLDFASELDYINSVSGETYTLENLLEKEIKSNWCISVEGTKFSFTGVKIEKDDNNGVITYVYYNVGQNTKIVDKNIYNVEFLTNNKKFENNSKETYLENLLANKLANSKTLFTKDVIQGDNILHYNRLLGEVETYDNKLYISDYQNNPFQDIALRINNIGELNIVLKEINSDYDLENPNDKLKKYIIDNIAIKVYHYSKTIDGITTYYIDKEGDSKRKYTDTSYLISDVTIDETNLYIKFIKPFLNVNVNVNVNDTGMNDTGMYKTDFLYIGTDELTDIKINDINRKIKEYRTGENGLLPPVEINVTTDFDGDFLNNRHGVRKGIILDEGSYVFNWTAKDGSTNREFEKNYIYDHYVTGSSNKLTDTVDVKHGSFTAEITVSGNKMTFKKEDNQVAGSFEWGDEDYDLNGKTNLYEAVEEGEPYYAWNYIIITSQNTNGTWNAADLTGNTATVTKSRSILTSPPSSKNIDFSLRKKNIESVMNIVYHKQTKNTYMEFSKPSTVKSSNEKIYINKLRHKKNIYNSSK